MCTMDAPTPPADEQPGDGRRETPAERLDRNWNEILQELRVTQTGIQILTGFLLTVPFQQRFAELTDDQRRIYLTLVVLAAVTTGLLVAPVSMHRWLFRRGAKSALVIEADRLMRVGLVFLVVTTRPVALGVAGGLFALLVGGWFVMPGILARKTRRIPPQPMAPPGWSAAQQEPDPTARPADGTVG